MGREMAPRMSRAGSSARDPTSGLGEEPLAGRAQDPVPQSAADSPEPAPPVNPSVERSPTPWPVADSEGATAPMSAPADSTSLGLVNQSFEEHPDGHASPGGLSLDPRAAVMVEPKAEHCGFGRDHGLFTRNLVSAPLQLGC